MSIFSKLLKRGPEDGGPPSAEAPAAASKPATPARAAPVTPPTPSAPGTGAAPPDAKAPSARGQAAAPAARPATGPSQAPATGATASWPAAKPAAARVAARAAPAVPAPAPGPPPARTAARPAVDATKGKAAPAVAERGGVPAEAQAPVGSVDSALDRLFSATGPTGGPAPGVSTASDHEAVMATFEELAVGHSADVRSLMMEVRWGEARASWFELARPALRSLRAMAGQVEHVALAAALDGFGAAVDEALRPGAPPIVAPAARDKLLAAYAPLVTALPAAFELQGERDRREPVVVRALLGQVPGLEPLMLDKMMGAGLGRLEALFQARAEEIGAVAGLRGDVAAAVVARVQAWRRATPATLATPDRPATARELATLVQALEADHLAFEEAARGWSEADRGAKRRLRRQREVGFLQLTIVLARLGEVDLALDLEKLPYARRLEELGRLVSRVGPGPAPGAPPSDGRARKIDRDVQSGAHAAP